ncbi:sensor histidine kinase [Lysinibacter cavernae]|uniref:Oxygen sensor histidine kinase NreB n=1 Tax=Lysinibacter cavernae TaxID=1640652 RepID=A0A7X5QZA9_9MICO|nr:sensor histidine kinase [Lysinibacter cavernae]NIH52770.1 signal transduction histidine kinase [Lysinibacter cavernae]
MKHTSLNSVFTGLRYGLHALIIGLSVLVVLRAFQHGDSPVAAAGDPAYGWVVLTLVVLFLAVYVSGAWLPNETPSPTRLVWLTVLTALWVVLAVLTPEAAFLVFPLFFLYLHLVPLPWNVLVVLMTTGVAIVTLSWNTGWSTGGVIGPLIGAGVAIAIGLGYQALFREAAVRNRLIQDLIETREQLAVTEREAGTLAERSRLAREIHDTVAQGLSSIQLLLHAVELEDPEHPAIDHIRLARETAAVNLLEARRFIAELSPPALQEHSLEGAISRLATATADSTGVDIRVTTSGDPVPLPMPVETALLRIAQGSLGNVAQHSNATRADVTLSYMGDAVSLDVVDNGIGFDRAAQRLTQSHPERQSFGLAAISDRAKQLGGSVSVESSPGSGTAVAVTIPLDPQESTE